MTTEDSTAKICKAFAITGATICGGAAAAAVIATLPTDALLFSSALMGATGLLAGGASGSTTADNAWVGLGAGALIGGGAGSTGIVGIGAAVGAGVGGALGAGVGYAVSAVRNFGKPQSVSVPRRDLNIG